jgi:hypothetical protein
MRTPPDRPAKSSMTSSPPPVTDVNEAMWTKLPIEVRAPPIRNTKSSMITESPIDTTSGATIFAIG